MFFKLLRLWHIIIWYHHQILMVRFWYNLCGACLFCLHYAVFHVTDQAGKKLTDNNLMRQVEKVCLSLPTYKLFKDSAQRPINLRNFNTVIH
jgi:hypothetical protein